MNAIKEIKNYILEHIHIENPEVWEFELTPNVTKLINSLNQTETNDFCNSVLEWEDEISYLITLSIYDSTNSFLDATLLYINIFSKIKDIEYLEILVENDIPFIRPPYDTVDKLKDWNKKQIENLKDNIITVMTVKSDSWNETLKEVVEYLNKQIENKASR
ncbi:hypothetical protein NMK71_05525 [Weeksellaceae bacterium KMM 9713]|uniref:Uncharacterized protein n=1 Tax=Profundicola chukchiensis TaxID=2961959 RepID=A0A9X4RWJ5_9FLAO|nr:hypothetical protein [Profundicola chukchiensis]MDG4945867.1 hypothetical protein [Profundicola chukchiensis]